MLLRIAIMVVLLGGSVLAFGYFAGASPDVRERSNAQTVIDDCRGRINDPLTPSAQKEALRFMCSGLRDEFVRKYGREP